SRIPDICLVSPLHLQRLHSLQRSVCRREQPSSIKRRSAAACPSWGSLLPPSCSARHEKGWANTPPERLLHPGRTGAPATLSAVGIDMDVPVVVEGHNRV